MVACIGVKPTKQCYEVMNLTDPDFFQKKTIDVKTINTGN